MYIIGDAETSSLVPMWSKIIDMLKMNDNIGPKIELMCPRHPEFQMHASNPEDFVIQSPEGGCSLRCGKRFSKFIDFS